MWCGRGSHIRCCVKVGSHIGCCVKVGSHIGCCVKVGSHIGGRVVVWKSLLRKAENCLLCSLQIASASRTFTVSGASWPLQMLCTLDGGMHLSSSTIIFLWLASSSRLLLSLPSFCLFCSSRSAPRCDFSLSSVSLYICSTVASRLKLLTYSASCSALVEMPFIRPVPFPCLI